MQTESNQNQLNTTPAPAEKFSRRKQDLGPAAAELSDIFTLAEFTRRHADIFTKGQMLWFIRNRDRNGLAGTGAVILSARKFYINEPLFSAWFTSQKA
ncbi:MAG: hypothetical protein WAW61_03340 [Methylococcaceae bacterium]